MSLAVSRMVGGSTPPGLAPWACDPCTDPRPRSALWELLSVCLPGAPWFRFANYIAGLALSASNQKMWWELHLAHSPEQSELGPVILPPVIADRRWVGQWAPSKGIF